MNKELKLSVYSAIENCTVLFRSNGGFPEYYICDTNGQEVMSCCRSTSDEKLFYSYNLCIDGLNMDNDHLRKVWRTMRRKYCSQMGMTPRQYEKFIKRRAAADLAENKRKEQQREDAWQHRLAQVLNNTWQHKK